MTIWTACETGDATARFCDLDLVLGYFVCFSCFSYLASVRVLVSFCSVGVVSVVCFELSVPVQVIAWKDTSLK